MLALPTDRLGVVAAVDDRQAGSHLPRGSRPELSGGTSLFSCLFASSSDCLEVHLDCPFFTLLSLAIVHMPSSSSDSAKPRVADGSTSSLLGSLTPCQTVELGDAV